MREIKFRGKRLETNEWVFGGIMQENAHPNIDEVKSNKYYVICANGKDYYVNQDTIGQFTGLFDKNGKEIYEGDIVRNNKNTLLLKTGYVKLVNGSYLLLDEEDDDFDFISNWCIEKEAYIIGNIHDNPELLK